MGATTYNSLCISTDVHKSYAQISLFVPAVAGNRCISITGFFPIDRKLSSEHMMADDMKAILHSSKLYNTAYFTVQL